MKIIGRIPVISPELVGSRGYRLLDAIYPEGVGPHTFGCELPVDDPRLARVLAVLADAGLRPWSARAPMRPNEYWMTMLRVYATDELAAFPYLHPIPEVPFESYDRSANGLVELDAPEIKPEADMASPRPRLIVVSTGLRGELEQKSFAHLLFRPVEVVGEKRERYLGKFWELTSDKILPRLSPTCKFGDCITGEDVAGDSPRAIGVRERAPGSDVPYETEELHYTASAIQEAGDFDLAVTLETFGGDSRYIVASQRFYQFCMERELDVEWTPVKIDAD